MIMSAKTKRRTRTAALKEVSEENANVLKPGIVEPRSNGLDLSGSDDSSDDDTADDDVVREKRLRLEKELEKKKREPQKNKDKKATKSKSGKAAVGVQLASLASIVEEEENLWKKKEDDCVDDELQEVDDSPRKKLDNDVAQLLKMGETEKERGVDEDSDDNDGGLVDAEQAPSQGEDDDEREAAQGKRPIV